MSYEVIASEAAIHSKIDLRTYIKKVEDMNTGTETYRIQAIYSGPFFTTAKEILPLNNTLFFDFVDEYYEEVVLDEIEGAETYLKYKGNNLILSGVEVVKMYTSEREAIVTDMIKNSAIK